MILVPLGFWINPGVPQELHHKVFTRQCHQIHPHWVAPTGHEPYATCTKPGAPLPMKMQCGFMTQSI